jgi:undecaprenyl-diphosphatase
LIATIAGSPGTYAGLFGLMFLAWAGLPVAGQPALVAAGVLAGNGQLSLTAVLVVGTVGSALGGCAGYLLGEKGGRALFTLHGPFHERRGHELERGKRLIDKYGAVAVLIAPTWVAGIFAMGWRKFLPWDLIAALAWTLAAGLGGFFFGPPVTKILAKANAAVVIALAVVLLTAGGVYYLRRRRKHRGEEQPTTPPSDQK